MSEDERDRFWELRLAELAATEGPVFALWRLETRSVDEVIAALVARGVRQMMTPEGDLIVHRNDGPLARGLIARLGGPDLEIDPDTGSASEPIPARLVTVYTAGGLNQANLVRARLQSVGIRAVLTHDPSLGMAALLAKDGTVRVQVSEPDVEGAEAELNGEVEDSGSQLPFRSRAWETPMRRAGAGSLLVVVGLWALPILLMMAFVLYQLVAP